MGPHVEHFLDAALHDDEVGVVDVELDRLEGVEDLLLLGFVPVEEPFDDIGQGDLRRNHSCVGVPDL